MNDNDIDGDPGFEDLIDICHNIEYFNKYCFANEYVPFIQIRKGFDYIDAYMATTATNNYLLFEKMAIDQVRFNRAIFFRCLFINDKGKIEHIIKRNISIEITNNNHLSKVDITAMLDGIYRVYDNQITEDEKIIQEIISTHDILYQCLIKNDKSIITHNICVSNNSSEDYIYNFNGDRLYKPVFIEAKVIYNDDGEFIDLEVIN